MSPLEKRGPLGNMQRRQPRAGFLLVEALATMAISAFLLVALASAVSLLLRASDRTARTGQEIEDTTRMMTSLARDIEQITPLRWAGKSAGFVFAGTARSLAFAQENTLPDGSVESRAVIFQSDDDQLIRAQAPLLPGQLSLTDLVMEDSQRMSQGRIAVRFAYFGQLASGQETLSDAWGRTDRMPVAIRISLTGRDGSPRGSLRVPIRVDAEPGCAAPGKAVCSFVPQTEQDADQQPALEAPIDPDDALGWARYAR